MSSRFLYLAMPVISEIIIYPVKSLKGVNVQTAELTDRGLKYDRRWMLVDADNRFLTQRELPAMALPQVSIHAEGLKVCAAGAEPLFIPFDTQALAGHAGPLLIETFVFEDRVQVEYCNPDADSWLSRVLGVTCRLVYMPDSSRRELSLKYSSSGELNSLSDSMPILLTSESSLALLNKKLELPIPMNRFRPNLVVSGGEAFEEDSYKSVGIAGHTFPVSKPCSRCTITTIDQADATHSKEPLKTLAGFRSAGRKVLFGIYLKVGGKGVIQVGDLLEVEAVVAQD